MANRNFPSQRIYNMHMMAVQLDAKFSVGASGAPTLLTSQQASIGIAAITRLVAGIYRIQLQDNYQSLLAIDGQASMAQTGSAIAGGSFSVGTVYQIVTLGTTTQAQWVTAGVPSGITADVGVVFKAATIGAGTGTVKALAGSGVNEICEIGGSTMLNNQPFNALSGGYVTIACMGPTDSTTTTQIPVDPANGSTVRVRILLSNSSVQ